MRYLLTLCLILATVAPVRADERVLPKHTAIATPDDPTTPKLDPQLLVLGDTHFLVERKSLDRANATAVTAKRLQTELDKCVGELQQELEPPSTSAWTKIKWAGFGMLVVSSFAAGLWVGSR